jgi:AcrR family transcriptional regulator
MTAWHPDCASGASSRPGRRSPDIATKLFAARGFDEVTISQVADAAGVAKMTVTNYFPRKEDLVFDLAEEIIGHLAKVVATRLPGESMLAAIRRDYADAVARADVTLGLSSPAFVRMIQNSPVLTSRALEIQHLREQALGDAIAAETGTDGPQERLVAALLASVHRVLNAEASRRSLAGRRARRSAPYWPTRPTAHSTCSNRPSAATASAPSPAAPATPATRAPAASPARQHRPARQPLGIMVLPQRLPRPALLLQRLLARYMS